MCLKHPGFGTDGLAVRAQDVLYSQRDRRQGGIITMHRRQHQSDWQLALAVAWQAVGATIQKINQKGVAQHLAISLEKSFV
jgi:hypothetical protein